MVDRWDREFQDVLKGEEKRVREQEEVRKVEKKRKEWEKTWKREVKRREDFRRQRDEGMEVLTNTKKRESEGEGN